MHGKNLRNRRQQQQTCMWASRTEDREMRAPTGLHTPDCTAHDRQLSGDDPVVVSAKGLLNVPRATVAFLPPHSAIRSPLKSENLQRLFLFFLYLTWFPFNSSHFSSGECWTQCGSHILQLWSIPTNCNVQYCSKGGEYRSRPVFLLWLAGGS